MRYFWTSQEIVELDRSFSIEFDYYATRYSNLPSPNSSPGVRERNAMNEARKENVLSYPQRRHGVRTPSACLSSTLAGGRDGNSACHRRVYEAAVPLTERSRSSAVQRFESATSLQEYVMD